MAECFKEPCRGQKVKVIIYGMAVTLCSIRSYERSLEILTRSTLHTSIVPKFANSADPDVPARNDNFNNFQIEKYTLLKNGLV